MRPDNAAAINKLKGTCDGGTALIVLGGSSGKDYAKLQNELKPDVLLGANGVNQMIAGLDYWMSIENMNYAAVQAANGIERAQRLMQVFQHSTDATKLVHHLSWPLLKNKDNAIAVNRNGMELNEMPADFTFREYGLGYLSGAMMQRPQIIGSLRVGTVGLQLLHHAAILGCKNVHTIGFDLCFKGEHHHWYNYPVYEVNRYWGENMFTHYKELDTLWFWVDTAKYLGRIYPMLARDGVNWIDHSRGLLEAEGIAQ